MILPLTGQRIRQLTATINRLVDKEMQAYGISYGQFEYFIGIANTEGITQQALATQLKVSKVSVTKAVHLLEKAGLIARMPHEDDARAVSLVLTQEGGVALKKIEVFRDQLEGQLFCGIAYDQIVQLNRTLSQLLANAQTIEKGVDT